MRSSSTVPDRWPTRRTKWLSIPRIRKTRRSAGISATRRLPKAVQVFTDELAASPSDELAAVATYADSGQIELLLTANYANVNNSLVPYTNALCSGSTNIGGGINAGVAALANSSNARPGAVKVLIVMTDGIHNTGTDPLVAAKKAAKQGIMIFTVTFADEADQTKMKAVAKIGQGEHFHAKTGAELEDVFLEIARRLPTLLTE